MDLENTTVILSEEFLRSSAIESSKIAIHAFCFNKDPYRWTPQQFPTSTDVLSLNVFNKNGTFTEKTDHNITINFKIRNPIEKSNIRKGFVKPRSDMPVYEMPLESDTYLMLDILSTTGNIKVLFMQGCRPRGYMFSKNYRTVNVTNPNQRLILVSNETKTVSAYFAVIPENENGNFLINFTFSIQSRRCQFFGDDSERWKTFLETGNDSFSDEFINCSTNHLSNFKATLFVMPNTLDFSRNLILQLKTNFLVVIFICGVFLVFCALLIYASYLDKTANRLIILTQLPSEKAAEQYPYIITVITGKFVLL